MVQKADLIVAIACVPCGPRRSGSYLCVWMRIWGVLKIVCCCTIKPDCRRTPSVVSIFDRLRCLCPVVYNSTPFYIYSFDQTQVSLYWPIADSVQAKRECSPLDRLLIVFVQYDTFNFNVLKILRAFSAFDVILVFWESPELWHELQDLLRACAICSVAKPFCGMHVLYHVQADRRFKSHPKGHYTLSSLQHEKKIIGI